MIELDMNERVSVECQKALSISYYVYAYATEWNKSVNMNILPLAYIGRNANPSLAIQESFSYWNCQTFLCSSIIITHDVLSTIEMWFWIHVHRKRYSGSDSYYVYILLNILINVGTIDFFLLNYRIVSSGLCEWTGSKFNRRVESVIYLMIFQYNQPT